MYLLIDNTNPDQIIWHYFLGDQWQSQIYPADSAGGVLGSLNQLLKSKKVSLAQIKGLAVLLGVGRFTATRVAVTVVNTLAYALQVPVAGVREIELEKLTEKIQSQPVGQLVSAEYSGEATIGGRK